MYVLFFVGETVTSPVRGMCSYNSFSVIVLPLSTCLVLPHSNHVSCQNNNNKAFPTYRNSEAVSTSVYLIDSPFKRSFASFGDSITWSHKTTWLTGYLQPEHSSMSCCDTRDIFLAYALHYVWFHIPQQASQTPASYSSETQEKDLNKRKPFNTQSKRRRY